MTLSSAFFHSAPASKVFNILLERMCREIDFEITVEKYIVSQKTPHLWFAITLTHVNQF